MKRFLGRSIKLVFTLLLFILIFTELGERYLPVPRSALTKDNTTLFLSGGKTLFGLRGSEPQPIALGEACGFKGGKISMRDETGKIRRVDIDVLCHEVTSEQPTTPPGDATRAAVNALELRVFEVQDEGYNEISLSAATAEQVYIKTRGWWRVAPIKPKDLWYELKDLDMGVFWFWMAFAGIMKFIGVFASMWRWAILLRGQSLILPFRYLLGTFFTARFFGMFLPGTLGLDGYRLYDSIRQTRRPIECTAVIAVEKLIGFVALFGLLFLTLPMGLKVIQSKGLPFNWTIFTIVLIVYGAIIGFALLILFWPWVAQTMLRLLPGPLKGRFQSKLDHVVKSTTAYANNRWLLIKAILLGFVVHFNTVLMYVGTMRAITTPEVNIIDIFFAAPLLITGTVFGPSIGGEGIRELVFTYLLGDLTSPAKAFLMAHLGFWVGEFLVSIPGAFFYALRPTGYKAKLTVADIEEVKKAK